jgi:hypothetical protein
MQRHECNKHNYLCINDSLKFLFPCENQGGTCGLTTLVKFINGPHNSTKYVVILGLAVMVGKL